MRRNRSGLTWVARSGMQTVERLTTRLTNTRGVAAKTRLSMTPELPSPESNPPRRAAAGGVGTASEMADPPDFSDEIGQPLWAAAFRLVFWMFGLCPFGFWRLDAWTYQTLARGLPEPYMTGAFLVIWFVLPVAVTIMLVLALRRLGARLGRPEFSSWAASVSLLCAAALPLGWFFMELGLNLQPNKGWLASALTWEWPAVPCGLNIGLVLGLIWLGWKRGGASPRILRLGWQLACAGGILAGGGWGWYTAEYPANLRKHYAVYAKMNLQQLAGAADQFFVENPNLIFVRYEELVGPKCYTSAPTPVANEDYRRLFPLRYGLTLAIRLPDGQTACYGDERDLHRPDGVHTADRPGGGRFETTYHGGVPDGLFRAFYPDGKLQSEATYVQGTIVGPCWHYLPDGTRFDELNRLTDEPSVDAQRRLRGKDFVRAEEEFTRALSWDPSVENYRNRGRVREQRKDIDGALADYQAALKLSLGEPGPGGTRVLSAETQEIQGIISAIVQRRAREKMAAEQAANASGLGAQLAGLRKLQQGQYKEAVVDFTRAVEQARGTKVAAFSLICRGQIRRLQNDLAGAAEDFRASTNSAARLWQYFTDCGRDRRDEARAELAAALDDSHHPVLSAWDAQIAGFLLGRVTEEGFFAKSAKEAGTGAFRERYQYLALFYSAMHRRIAGDQAGALEQFRKMTGFSPETGLEMEAEEARRAVAAAAK